MIKLIPVSNSDELNDDLQQIYMDSFPADERREWQQVKEVVNHQNFSLNRVFDDQKFVGLVSVWNLPFCVFIEHFAIHESVRGKGIGTHVFVKIIERNPSKIVLEVEEPTTDVARRRIAFYKRLGFSVCEGIYYQPPYFPNTKKVKMLLMSYPVQLNPNDFEEIKNQVYRDVYHVE